MGDPVRLTPFVNALASKGLMEGSLLAITTNGWFSVWGFPPGRPPAAEKSPALIVDRHIKQWTARRRRP